MKKEILLNTSLIEARKKGDRFTSNVLSTMKGEIENQLKNKAGQDIEKLIEGYSFKSKKNLLSFKPKDWEIEMKVLEPFLPKEITEEDVVALIDILREKGTPEKSIIGLVMKELKGVDIELVKPLIHS